MGDEQSIPLFSFGGVVMDEVTVLGSLCCCSLCWRVWGVPLCSFCSACIVCDSVAWALEPVWVWKL